MTEEFLVVGWKFPVKTYLGKIAMSKYDSDIREAIWIILGTAKGERVMHPDFGCGIHGMLFQTTETKTLDLIEMAVCEALSMYEPRIEVMKVNVSSEEAQVGKLLISIDYRVKVTKNQFNIVYPFYLSEGQ